VFCTGEVRSNRSVELVWNLGPQSKTTYLTSSLSMGSNCFGINSITDNREGIVGLQTGLPSGFGRRGEFLCLSPRPAQADPDKERQPHGGFIPVG
jgi:hypothetical protein